MIELTLKTGEVVYVLSRDPNGTLRIVDKDSCVVSFRPYYRNHRFSNRFFQLPEWLFGDPPSRRQAMEAIRKRKQLSVGYYAVFDTSLKCYSFKTLKRAFSKIKALGSGFSSMYYVDTFEEHLILSNIGVPSKKFLRCRDKVSVNTLRREWKRIEKTRIQG